MRAALRIVKSLYFQVLVAVALGVTLGFVKPSWGEAARPLGDAFIRLVKMMIAPIVLVTVTTGIAGLGDLKKVGRVGVKALFYFEAVTTVALAVGLGVVHLVRPGDGLHIDVRTVDTSGLAAYTGTAAKGHGLADVLRELIPDTMVGAVAKGEILGVLLVSILLGMAISGMGDKGKPLLDWLALVQKALFGAVKLVMYLAPLGAFGAMAFTVGKYGVSSLVGLGKLVACFYLTSFLFVALALGAILKVVGLSIVKLVRYLGEELLVVLSTSSSESALPRLMDKLEHLGCSKAVVGLVVPTGYSFNLDGTAIYLTMAAMFVAQATDTHLSFGAELGILGVLLLTSKGAAAVTGGGFVTLAATLATTGDIPVAGLAILLGVDRFLSEARALTNLVGNAVATIVVARWEGELDVDRARDVLDRR